MYIYTLIGTWPIVFILCFKKKCIWSQYPTINYRVNIGIKFAKPQVIGIPLQTYITPKLMYLYMSLYITSIYSFMCVTFLTAGQINGQTNWVHKPFTFVFRGVNLNRLYLLLCPITVRTLSLSTPNLYQSTIY